MKKILFILLLSILTLTGNAQIYSTIKRLDKFDDIVKTENVKTRITIHKLDSIEWFGVSDLSIIEIETKGKEPVKYFSIYKTSFGDEENIKEITNGLYGYQTHYLCVNLKTIGDNIDSIISHIYCETDSIINNAANVYVPEDKKESFQKITDEYIQNMEENADSLIYHSVRLLFFKHKKHFLNVLLDREELEDGEFILTDRTVTTQYSGTFLDRLFWVKYNDDSRTIYLNN